MMGLFFDIQHGSFCHGNEGTAHEMVSIQGPDDDDVQDRPHYCVDMERPGVEMRMRVERERGQGCVTRG